MIETARRLAAEAGVPVQFDVGDCENLPYPNASFEVVSSAHGVIFGPDHRAVAQELTRVCRPGGRIGLTAWRLGGALEVLLSTPHWAAFNLLHLTGQGHHCAGASGSTSPS